MSDNNVLSKLNKIEFHLNKVVANRIDKEPKGKKLNINQDAICTVLERTKEKLNAKINIRISIDPEALFSMEIEHIVEIIFREETTDQEIERNINEIVAPLGAEISYIIASLTEKMFGAHIILPPGIKIDKINNLYNQ
ncbi:MAG: hypothetical protein GYA02_11840 [Clostridiaceae bacterium]|nr:hypothetical protein [Clostridiaceae bacterium]